MSKGFYLDSFRYRFSSPSQAVISSWSTEIQRINIDAGLIRLLDTGDKKPVILMSPDGPCVIEHFSHLISELRKSYRVIVFEMPGNGFSYPKPGYDFSLESSGNVILSVMNTLQIKKATLSFSCVNSYAAMLAAKEHPDRVSKLILSQTPALEIMQKQWVHRNIPEVLFYPFVGQIFNMIFSETMTAKWFDMSIPPRSSDKEIFRHHALDAIKSGGCFCLASVVQAMKSAEIENLKKVEVPSLMVWGNRDFSHKGTDFQSIQNHITHCEIHRFDKCGHFPYLEKPEEFTLLLKKW